MIVRETESEARAAANKLVSRLDDQFGEEIRNRALDAKTLGVALQSQAREQADDDGFIEDNLWTGIGRARSGCGMAIVGDPDQVVAKIKNYIDMGMRSFIFSGYPHLEESQLFAKYVLPQLETLSMPIAQGRKPATTPMTPLGAGQRV